MIRIALHSILLITLTSLCLHAEDNAKTKRVVMMIGEEEYLTWETLPEFGKSVLEPAGFAVTVIQADPKDLNTFPGLIEALKSADVLIVSVKRRLLPKDQLEAVRAYVQSGKPIVGIRTACHAFELPRNMKDKSKIPEGHAHWIEFDPEVLGAHYDNHWGKSDPVTLTVVKENAEHPILKGVDVKGWVGHGTLYRMDGLVEGCTPLLMGSIPDKPAEPIAWVREYGPNKALIFYTALGNPEDFKDAPFRKLLENAVKWAVKL